MKGLIVLLSVLFSLNTFAGGGMESIFDSAGSEANPDGCVSCDNDIMDEVKPFNFDTNDLSWIPKMEKYAYLAITNKLLEKDDECEELTCRMSQEEAENLADGLDEFLKQHSNLLSDTQLAKLRFAHARLSSDIILQFAKNNKAAVAVALSGWFGKETRKYIVSWGAKSFTSMKSALDNDPQRIYYILNYYDAIKNPALLAFKGDIEEKIGSSFADEYSDVYTRLSNLSDESFARYGDNEEKIRTQVDEIMLDIEERQQAQVSQVEMEEDNDF